MATGPRLTATDDSIVLVPISMERDAALGVEWLRGDDGRETLRNMGVTDTHNHESTLELEQARLQQILDDPAELAWMIELNGQVIGITEVHLDQFEHCKGPSVHIMIGDKAARGQGAGLITLQTVIRYLHQSQRAGTIFSRHLTSNQPSAALLHRLGFVNDGPAYHDADDLEWQNVVL